MLLSLLCIFASSCKQKPKELKTYNLTISKKELNVYGSGYEDVDKKDTVRATDDTTAYYRGVLKYAANLKAEELTKNRVSTSKSFTITDSLGGNIGINLSKEVKDSIHKRFSLKNL